MNYKQLAYLLKFYFDDSQENSGFFMDPVDLAIAIDPVIVPNHPGGGANTTRIYSSATLRQTNNICPATRQSLVGLAQIPATTFMQTCALALFNACGSADLALAEAEIMELVFLRLQDLATLEHAPIPHVPDRVHPDAVYQSLRNIIRIVKGMSLEQLENAQHKIAKMLTIAQPDAAIHLSLQNLFAKIAITPTAEFNPDGIELRSFSSKYFQLANLRLQRYLAYIKDPGNICPQFIRAEINAITMLDIAKEEAEVYSNLLTRLASANAARSMANSATARLLQFTHNSAGAAAGASAAAGAATAADKAASAAPTPYENPLANLTDAEIRAKANILEHYEFYLAKSRAAAPDKLYAELSQAERESRSKAIAEAYKVNIADFSPENMQQILIAELDVYFESYAEWYFEFLIARINKLCPDLDPAIRASNNQVMINLRDNSGKICNYKQYLLQTSCKSSGASAAAKPY